MTLDHVKVDVTILEPTVPNAPRVPLHWRTVLVRDGEIFASAAMWSRSEAEILACAYYDGVGVLRFKGHAYVPIDWLEREFPAFRESASLLRGKNLRGLSR
jgi:hypothetical protein